MTTRVALFTQKTKSTAFAGVEDANVCKTSIPTAIHNIFWKNLITNLLNSKSVKGSEGEKDLKYLELMRFFAHEVVPPIGLEPKIENSVALAITAIYLLGTGFPPTVTANTDHGTYAPSTFKPSRQLIQRAPLFQASLSGSKNVPVLSPVPLFKFSS